MMGRMGRGRAAALCGVGVAAAAVACAVAAAFLGNAYAALSLADEGARVVRVLGWTGAAVASASLVPAALRGAWTGLRAARRPGAGGRG